MPDRLQSTDDRVQRASVAAISLRTAISGREPVTHLRGYALAELAAQPQFLEIFHLLTEGEFPTAEQLSDLQCRWQELPPLDPAAREHLASLPWNVTPLEAMRSGLVFLSHDVERENESPQEQCLRLMSELAEMIATRYCATQGVPLPPPPEGECLPGRLLTQLCGQPPEQMERDAVEAFFLVSAECCRAHSTWAVRAAGGAASKYSIAVLAGLSAIECAEWSNEAQSIYDLLDEVESIEQFEAIWEGVRDAGCVPPGFSVEAVQSAEVALLTEHCRTLAEDRGQSGYEELAELFALRVEQEFGASPTLQWTLTRLFFYLGLEFELLTPLVCLARLPGWCAHFREQQGTNLAIQCEYSGTLRTLNRS